LPKRFFSIGFAVFDFLIMDNSLIDILLAMAPPASGEGQGGASWMQCLFPLAFLGIFYALLIRPQQQQQKQHAKMVSELKSGSRVVAGGMVGSIISVKKETVTLRTGEAKIEMMRSAVEKILPDSGDIND
jgi:preprotein translocase subunit YajC